MKETTGGALLMGLAVVMLLIFIIFGCFFISYGKNFKIKNQVINYIEQNEGLTVDQIRTYIKDKTNYNYNSARPLICYVNNGSRGFTYKITLYMTFNPTILGDVMSFKIPIEGETSSIISGVLYDKLVSGQSASSVLGVLESGC